MIDVVYSISNLTDGAWKRFENSYKSLVATGDEFRICVSEMGKKSDIEKVRSIVGDCGYFFQQTDGVLNTSITKNNAFRNLIENNLFIIIDVDIVVPHYFFQKAFQYLCYGLFVIFSHFV